MAGSSDSHASRVLAGRYRLIHLAGKGGMGVVWQALDESISRTVAIKLVLPAHTEEEHLQRLARLERERRVLIDLSQHPNIVTLFDILTEPLGYVMEWFDGWELEAWLNANPGPRPPEVVAALMAPVLDAVGFAHEHGVIHRDLKASNIFLQNLGERLAVRVMDFGLARIVQQESDISTGRLLIGTPQYMAPEQILGEASSAATDIYALGIVLYECLTGQMPIEDRGESPIPILVAKTKEEIAAPQEKYPELSDALNAVIVKATRRDPKERFASCAELSDALFAALPDKGRHVTRRIEADAIGNIPTSTGPSISNTSHLSSKEQTSNISYAALYGHHDAIVGSDQRHVATAINAPPRDLADDGVGEHGLPGRDASGARGIGNRTFLYGERISETISSHSFSARGGTIVLLLLLVLAGVLAIPFLARSSRNIDDYTPPSNSATHIDGVPWNIRGIGADGTEVAEAMRVYLSTMRRWNSGKQGTFIGGYRAPLRCYYNQSNLPPEQIPTDPYVRTTMGLAPPPFTPENIFISNVGPNYVTFIEKGTAGYAKSPYVRLVQMTRARRSSTWRVSVETNTTAHDCYDSFRTNYEKWISAKQKWRREAERASAKAAHAPKAHTDPEHTGETTADN